MVCQLRLTRQSCQPEVHKLTPPSPDPSWRFAPPIRKLSVPILGTLEKKERCNTGVPLTRWTYLTAGICCKTYFAAERWPWASILLSFIFLAHKFKSARNKVSERMYNLGDIYVVECAILLRIEFVCSQDSELMLTRELYTELLNEAEQVEWLD